MSHQHLARGVPASPLRSGAESGSRSQLRSQHGFSQDPKSQRLEASRQTARATNLALSTFLEKNKDSSDDGDIYSTVQELDQLAPNDRAPSATKQPLGKTGFDVRVSTPTQDMNKWLSKQQRKMAAVL